MKCQVCENKESVKNFYDNAGDMYDMESIKMNFSNVCKPCWNDLCDMKSDLTEIAVMYHRERYHYNSANDFLKSNKQLDNNKFYKTNLVFRNGKPVLVGDRRKEIENLCKLKGDK